VHSDLYKSIKITRSIHIACGVPDHLFLTMIKSIDPKTAPKIFKIKGLFNERWRKKLKSFTVRFISILSSVYYSTKLFEKQPIH
jgi:hypothetical protein